jgi:hypothetical protein
MLFNETGIQTHFSKAAKVVLCSYKITGGIKSLQEASGKKSYKVTGNIGKPKLDYTMKKMKTCY